ncbi:hypothetical protein SAMN05216345_101890 [Cupriavidus sp. YR651]|uniref:hypothetical protein n=1 Tax=Cupriavidus sp. YR651 TaxID=1855315 RepID=UPI00088DBF06|nr:hypothetical protein [Cupriavidus sp. YR651]SDC19806.1 hypothetical protein SAMN05216345_101890 [Cupriavidus sp. YR651]
MYTQIIPATDWFFVHPDVKESAPPTVWHLAAWGLTPEGKVVGLVGGSVEGCLVGVPRAAKGVYLHRDQLSEAERQLMVKR